MLAPKPAARHPFAAMIDHQIYLGRVEPDAQTSAGGYGWITPTCSEAEGGLPLTTPTI